MARLLVLWILSERASYGYEIKKALSDDGVAFWFGLEDASIYSVLRTLTKHGHARVVGTEREGARPTRTRYAITASGRRLYRAELVEALSTPRLPVAPIDVALAARGDLAESVVDEALGRRAKRLDDIQAQIKDAQPASPSPAIVERNLALVQAEREWLAQLDHAAVS